MTLQFNDSLATTLASASSKLDWANKVQTALTNTRTLVCKQDLNSGTNPAVTGSTFLSVGMTGPLAFTAGNITGFGVATGTTTQSAVNLLNGTSSLRITGGGNYVQGTLGLSRAAQSALGVSDANLKDYDFTFSSQPTATNGVGFNSKAGTKAPKLLPSGTGPVAPQKVATSPNSVEIYSYETGFPVLAATAVASFRDDDYVFQDSEMAASMGDTAIYRTAQDSVWGKFKFGVYVTINNQNSTVPGTVPLYQVLVPFAYNDPAWSNYPEQTQYNPSTMVLTLPAFKAVVKDANNNVLYTWETPGGAAINDPSLYSANANDGGRLSTANANKPLHPRFNCQQALFWENVQPRQGDLATKLVPGPDPTKLRRTMGRSYLTYNIVEPILTGGYDGDSRNGSSHIWVTPPFPLAPSNGPVITDTYLDVGQMFNSGSSAYGMGWWDGYAYYAGARGGQNWYTGPGGVRPDRCVVPSVFAYYMAYPNEVRPQNSVAWREVADGFRKNYWNHSNLVVTSPSTLTLDTNENLLNNGWALVGNYYGDYSYTGKAIRINGDQRGGTDGSDYDVAGNLIRSGHGRDALHDYCNRGLAALLFNSPMHAIGSKFDTVNAFMLHRSADEDKSSGYMVRSMAWEWLHHVIAWKLGTSHPLGFTQAEIEARFSRVLKAIYINTYVPAFVNNSLDIKHRSLRNLGCIISKDSSGNWWNPAGRLGYYMGQVLMLMKQTGFWKRMRDLDPIHVIVLDNLLRNMDKFCFDTILDTSGAVHFGGQYYAMGPGTTEAGIPDSWAQLINTSPLPAAADFVHDETGAYKAEAGDMSNLLRQWAYIRKAYFPEIASARVDAAIAKFDAYEQVTIDMVNAATTIAAKIEADHRYAHPGICIPKAPAVLGPA